MPAHEQHEPPAQPTGSTGLDRGTNQTGLRLYNERLVLSLIRDHQALPKAEIARKTGLSAQTISVIIRQLEADALVLPDAPLRGRVGQPSVPYRLNRDGAFSFGLKIGRRSADLVLMDFIGDVVDWRRITYRYPTTDAVVAFANDEHASMIRSSGRDIAGKEAGLGVAMPFELWSWAEHIGAEGGAMESWKGFHVESALSRATGLPVYLCNDVTAACGAELAFSQGAVPKDFMYFFVGTFVGGGLVINGSLYPGHRGNAAAVGSILVPIGDASNGAQQLVRQASICVLEQRLSEAGLDPSVLWQSVDGWSDLGAMLDEWLDDVARGLAYAIVASVSVLDLAHIVVDGAFPDAVRSKLVEKVRAASASLEWTGLLPAEIHEGSLGDRARAFGAASLPLTANFTRDSEVLFKTGSD